MACSFLTLYGFLFRSAYRRSVLQLLDHHLTDQDVSVLKGVPLRKRTALALLDLKDVFIYADDPRGYSFDEDP